MSKLPAQKATAADKNTTSASRVPFTPIQAAAGAIAKAHPKNMLAAQVKRLVYG